MAVDLAAVGSRPSVHRHATMHISRHTLGCTLKIMIHTQPNQSIHQEDSHRITPGPPCHHRSAAISAHHLLHHHSHLLLTILSLIHHPSISLLQLTCAIGHLLLNPPVPHLIDRLRLAWATRLLFHTPLPPDLLSECTLLNNQYPDVAHVVSPLAIYMLAALPRCTAPNAAVYQSASNTQGSASAAIPARPAHTNSVLVQPFLIQYLFARGPFRSRKHILARGGGTWGPPTDRLRTHSRTWSFAPDVFLLLSFFVRLGHANFVTLLLRHMRRIDPMLMHIPAPLSVWVQSSLDLRPATWLANHALITQGGNPQPRMHEWAAYVAAGDVAVHVLDAIEIGVGARVEVGKWPHAIVGALVGRLASVRIEARADRGIRDRLVATVGWLRERGLAVVLGGEEVG